MRVWCVTDRETAQLRTNGMLGVAIKIGNSTLMPGGSMEVPSHLIAELQSAFRAGMLSLTEPPALPAKPTPVTKVVPVKSEPVKFVPIETVTVETETPPETPEPDNNEQRRRRR